MLHGTHKRELVASSRDRAQTTRPRLHSSSEKESAAQTIENMGTDNDKQKQCPGDTRHHEKTSKLRLPPQHTSPPEREPVHLETRRFRSSAMRSEREGGAEGEAKGNRGTGGVERGPVLGERQDGRGIMLNVTVQAGRRDIIQNNL